MPAIDLPPPADFAPPQAAEVRSLEPGELQLQLGTHTTPRNRGQGGMALWALNTWGAGGGVDVGLVTLGPVTLSGGASGSVGQPVLLQLATNELLAPLLPVGQAWLDVSSWSLEGRMRAQLARHPDAAVQPRLGLAFGVRRLSVDAAYDLSMLHTLAGYQLTSRVLTPSLGLDVVNRRGTFVSAELGYGLGLKADSVADVYLGLDVFKNPIIEARRDDVVKAPRGMVAGLSVGQRF